MPILARSDSIGTALRLASMASFPCMACLSIGLIERALISIFNKDSHTPF